LWGFSLFNARYSGNLRQGYEGEKMANKEQKGNANTKKEPKLSLKEKRLQKQEKKSKKD